MSNSVLQKDQISNVVPNWQHPVLPGHAVQGSLLFTLNDFVNPPQSESNFKWIPMEKIVGTHDIKLTYDETKNQYHILKSFGHLNNDNTWAEDWYDIGTINGITEETQEALESLVYVEYTFDTTTANTLKVIGTKKDGTQVTLCNIQFVDATTFSTAITNLQTLIDNEVTRATSKENDLQSQVTKNKITAGNGLEANETTTGTGLKVVVGNGLQIDSDKNVAVKYNQLKAMGSDDTNGLKVITNEKSITNDTDGSLKAKVDKGLSETNNGISVNVDNSTVKINNSNQLFVDPSVTTYTAGAGIDITDNVISATGVSFATGNGLKVEGSGTTATLQVAPATKSGLDFNADKTMFVNVDNDTIKIDDNNKIVASSSVSVDNQSIKKDTSNVISVNVNANGGLETTSNGVGIKVTSDGALGISANGLTIEADEETITRDSTTNTLKVLHDNESIEIGTGVGLKLKEDTNGAIVTGTDGVKVQVGNALNIVNNNIELVEGNGITVDNSQIDINTNFATKTEELGTNTSGLALYNDGKIGLDASIEEWTFTLSDGSTVTKKVAIFN